MNVSQLSNSLTGESIEDHANSNYRYFAQIGRADQAYVIGGQCNRLNFDFPIGSLVADNSG